MFLGRYAALLLVCLARPQNPTTADRFSGFSGYWSGYQCQPHIPSALIPTSSALCNTWGVLGVIWGSGLVCGEVWGSAWFGEWASFRKEGECSQLPLLNSKSAPASDSPFQLCNCRRATGGWNPSFAMSQRSFLANTERHQLRCYANVMEQRYRHSAFRFSKVCLVRRRKPQIMGYFTAQLLYYHNLKSIFQRLQVRKTYI